MPDEKIVVIYISQDEKQAKFVYNNKEEIYKIENMINHIFYLYDNYNYSIINIIYNKGPFLLEIEKQIKEKNTINRKIRLGLTIPKNKGE